VVAVICVSGNQSVSVLDLLAWPNNLFAEFSPPAITTVGLPEPGMTF